MTCCTCSPKKRRLLRSFGLICTSRNLSSHFEVRVCVIGCVVSSRLVLLATFLVKKCPPAGAFHIQNRADWAPPGRVKSMIPCGVWRNLALVLCFFLLSALVEALAPQLPSIFVPLARTFAAAVGSCACPACTFAHLAATFAAPACKFTPLGCTFAHSAGPRSDIRACGLYICT